MDAECKQPMPERRQAGRATFRLAVRATIYPPPDQKKGTVRICHLLAQDLSDTGISAVYTRPFAIGQRIDFDTPDGRRSAAVCRVTAMSNGSYLAGCKFLDHCPTRTRSDSE
jgi:hypothetical protein